MGLTWTAPGEIARALSEPHPVADPQDLSVGDLQRSILALPDLDDDSDETRESRLGAIVAAWHDGR